LFAANALLGMTAAFAVEVKAGRYTDGGAEDVVRFRVAFHVLLGAALSPAAGSPRSPGCPGSVQ
jgi:hypothetical protein